MIVSQLQSHADTTEIEPPARHHAMENGQVYLIIAFAFMVCAFCQWLAWRLKLPAILFLLLAGILVGPVFDVLRPEELLGRLFFPFVSLSVAVILFEGSITLKFRDILGLGSVLRNMLTVGLLATWLITTGATRLLTGFSWEISFLFGAITVVTGPTVIAPLLRAVRPTAGISHILRWEGIVIDPIGASLAVLVFEFIISESPQQAWGQTLFSFFQLVGLGSCIGAAAGYGYGLVLRHRWLPEFLQNITTLALILCAFVIANAIQPESGLVAVTVLGLWLANMRGVDLDEILRFKESLSILLVSLLFLMLTARLDAGELRDVGWAAVLLFLVVQFLARPLNIFLAALGSSLRRPERLFLAWIAPRGIVAAAISSLFAFKLQEHGFGEARYLAPLAFAVIIGTVLLQSLTALPLARRLGVAEPEPNGFLIIGANRVARTIGAALAAHGARVLLADTDWEKVSLARERGLDVYHGSLLSEYADRRLNLTGIGRMLALSPYRSVNMAAAMRFRHEFGRNSVYAVGCGREGVPLESYQATESRYTIPLFGSDITYHQLLSLFSAGTAIEIMRLDKTAGYDEFRSRRADTIIVLFFVDPKGRIVVASDFDETRPEAGWAVAYVDKDAPPDTGS